MKEAIIGMTTTKRPISAISISIFYPREHVPWPELLAELRRQNRAGEEQIHALLMVKIMALGTFVSCSLVIFFSPSNKRNDSKVGGAFMVAKNCRKSD